GNVESEENEENEKNKENEENEEEEQLLRQTKQAKNQPFHTHESRSHSSRAKNTVNSNSQIWKGKNTKSNKTQQRKPIPPPILSLWKPKQLDSLDTNSLDFESESDQDHFSRLWMGYFLHYWTWYKFTRDELI